MCLLTDVLRAPRAANPLLPEGNNILEESQHLPEGNFEIGRFLRLRPTGLALRVLHLKSEIRNRNLARRNLPLRLQRSIRGKLFSYVHSGDEPKFMWTGGPYA